MTDQSPPELGKQSGGRYQLNGVGMPQNTEYAKARVRLDGVVDVTGVGGIIRIRKDDLLAVLARLDDVEAIVESVPRLAPVEERAE